MCQHNGASFSAVESEPSPVAAVDHHLHIQSAAASKFLREQARRVPQVFKGISGALLQSRTGADALHVLDEGGVDQGVLLSEAYIFTSPHFLPDGAGPDADIRTRQENQFNVEAALHSGGRLKAFISVNPLHARAVDEVSYWAGKAGVAGLKLHLSNSAVRLDDGAHIAALVQIFRGASAAALPIVMHARTFPAGAARTLVQEVLPHATDIPVQLAHAGGEGGLSQETLRALEVYAAAIARQAPGTVRLLFDLAVVAVSDDTEPQSARSLTRALAELMRKIGLSYFVLGSDWPSVCTPRQHTELLRAQYSLTSQEWSALLTNRAPYLDTNERMAS